MKIVIDMSEVDYCNIKNELLLCYGTEKLAIKVTKAFQESIPLPEHHGDLIDRDELLKQPMDLANYPSNYVRIASIIIPATKEGE